MTQPLSVGGAVSRSGGYRSAVKGRISRTVVASSTAWGSTSSRKSLKTWVAPTSW